MTEIEIFSAALRIRTPWEIEEILFKKDCDGEESLHIHLGHKRGAMFEYDGELCKVHDHNSRVWRHLDFFEHKCYLYADVPRVRTKDGKVRTVEVPWASPGSSFTLLYEQKVIELVKNGMSASKSGETMRVDSRVVFRIIKRCVLEALCEQSIEEVKRIGIDETSYKRGHKYLTIVTDRDNKKVVGIGFGKDVNALEQSIIEMEVRGGCRKTIKNVTMDMSKSYISGVTDFMPQADVIFDRFHLSFNLNKAIDKIRRREQKEFTELKSTKFLWLSNKGNLSEENLDLIEALSEKYQNIGQAYKLKELFREVFDNAQRDSRLKWLNNWMKLAWDTEIGELQDFVNMLKRHWYGIKTYFKYLATNALSERVNLTIQEIKRVAKGYRNLENYKLMIYLKLGGLNLGNPH